MNTLSAAFLWEEKSDRPQKFVLWLRWHLGGQFPQELAEGVGVKFQLGDTGTLARNAEKLNMHNAANPYEMIA